MARVNLGKVVPEKGVDYMTPEEEAQFVRDITSDVQSELLPYITEKKTEIEGVASSATSEFNSNAAEKTQDFNENAEEKKEELEIELTDYSLITETGSKIVLDINSSTFKIKAILKDKNNNVIDTSNEIDLPLESVVVNGSYNSQTKKVVLTLENGNTIEFSVADLVAGLQTEITSSNKLASDLVDDTNSTNKFVSANDKTNWNGKEDASNKVTTISSSSTDTQYPSAKAVYNYVDGIVGDINDILDEINGEII